MPALLDITGERYGRLVAIRRAGYSGGRVTWLFQCDCGATTECRVDAVRLGNSRSCGCRRTESNVARLVTHGHSRGNVRSRELRAWDHAKGRCLCPTDGKYPRYGGRGITMCDRWKESFQAFFDDMGPCPAGMTLERNDVNGNYEPGNCRWATNAEQARNRTDNVFVEHNGQRMILKAFAALMGVNYHNLHYLVRRRGVPVQTAIARLQTT